MKVVFLHLGREHLGLEYLSAVLKNKGHNVELLCDAGLFGREDNVFYSPLLEGIYRRKEIVKEAIRLKPDLIAFSPYTTTYRWACGIAEELKERISVPMVFGGIHSTLAPLEVIKNDFVDFVIAGEAESAFLELIERLEHNGSLFEVENLWFKKNGEIIQNRLRQSLQNLDELPLPDKELFSSHIRFKDDYMIMASRGCLFNCSYCCESFLNKMYKNQFFRRRSVNSVIKELKTMKGKYNFREVMFFDSILFSDKKWLKELLSRYKMEINVPFRCTGHVSLFDYEVGRLLKDAGCYDIDFGVQTFNQEVRKNILNRSETNRKIKEVFNICDELGIRYDVDLMFGLPGAKLEDYFLPIDFMKDAKLLNRLKCYYLSYFPKTDIVEKAKNLGILDDKDIDDINEGKIGDWFHLDSIKDVRSRRWKNNFSKIYKIYPLLPYFLKRKIAKGRFYRYFYMIPNFFIVFLQLLIGLKNRDYRFKIYINNYLYSFMKKIKN